MLPDSIDTLYGFASGDLLRDEIVHARAEYFAAVKDVYDEEHFFEDRMNSFLEWYCVERFVGKTGMTPLDLFMEANEGTLEETECAFFSGLRISRHSLFMLLGYTDTAAIVRDQFSGERLTVAVDRPIVTLKKGDLIDTRLIPIAGEFHFGRSFLVHPRPVRKAILREIKEAKSELRLDTRGFLRHLSVLWVRHQRYKGVNPGDLYTSEELSSPNPPLF